MISHFKNRHLGQTCIIIGNGPSLKLIPRPFLDSLPTFGQNKCYLNEPPLVDFTPTFYVTSDPDKDIDYYPVSLLKCDKFVKLGLMLPKHNVHTFVLTPRHIFSFHPDIEVYEGYSVTFISLQLAYYFGFSTVLLVGVDHKYIKYNPDLEPDPNHYTDKYQGKTDFSPESLKKGDRFIKEAMILANIAYINDGRRIVNLNRDSNLRVFEFDDVENWM